PSAPPRAARDTAPARRAMGPGVRPARFALTGGRRPGRESARLELERHHLGAVLLERGRDPVLAVEAGEQHEVPAAARPRHLPADRALAAGEPLEPVPLAPSH